MNPASITLRAPSLRGRVACVDLETTGGLSARHRIIEVGIVLLDDGRVVEEWSSLVNPGVRIPTTIAEFTGISNEMVADAPDFAGLRREIRQRLDGALFVAHNARFDYGFLRHEFRRQEERFSAPVLCTVRLSRDLFRQYTRHNLESLIERFDLECDARHRALGDARVLPSLLAAMEAATGENAVQQAVEGLLTESRLPPQLSADLLDDLPEGPGVYLFRGESGALLYVGKSRNLRSRVLSHFGEAQRSGREARLASELRDIEWIETGGEFGALLLESRLVKDLAPSANRRLRRSQTLWCLRIESGDGSGPRRPVIERFDGEMASAAATYGPFRSERDGRRALEGKAREAQLCLKLLGLEPGAGSCFAYQLGRCRGACVGREPAVLHDARLMLALAPLQLRAWPFAGAIAIREAAAGGSGEVLHVLDRWRHLGTARNEQELQELLQTAERPEFDLDAYKLISRRLERLRAGDVVLLGPGRGGQHGD